MWYYFWGSSRVKSNRRIRGGLVNVNKLEAIADYIGMDVDGVCLLKAAVKETGLRIRHLK